MSWFNLPDDEDLLHASVRDHNELENAIEKAEFDVFHTYKEYNGEYTVKLRGFNEDPDEADERLVEAVKYTIADLVSFRLRSYQAAQNVSSQRQGQRTWSFFRQSPAWDVFPDNWQYRLSVFDTREVPYHV